MIIHQWAEAMLEHHPGPDHGTVEAEPMATASISTTAIVYQVTNRVNGKKYIGITSVSLRKRWSRHIEKANSKTKTKNALQHAILKYGPDAFDVVELERMESFEAAAMRERELIAELDTIRRGYNRTSGGEGLVGWKHSLEVCAKLSESHKGLHPSLKTRAKLSASLAPMLCARNRSPEHRAAITTAAKNRSPERQAQVSAALSAANKNRTPEQRAKHVAILRARNSSPEFHAKIAPILATRNRSPEQRAAARKRSPEQRAARAAMLCTRNCSSEQRAKSAAAHKREVWKRRCCFTRMQWLRLPIRHYALSADQSVTFGSLYHCSVERLYCNLAPMKLIELPTTPTDRMFTGRPTPYTPGSLKRDDVAPEPENDAPTEPNAPPESDDQTK
jgi:group I intron endonuclease